MIYSLYNHELGSEDAYSRVLGPEHRDTVKEAFNVMFQANTELKSKPSKLSLDEIGMSWKELREAILNAHKPIKDLFFTGLGNRLQFEDSIIAESIMLQFAKMDYPALPIHDSFLMHHAFGNSGELEEAMRRAFYERFNRDIGISRELVVTHSISEINKNEDMKDILSSAAPYCSYNKRNDLWLNRDK